MSQAITAGDVSLRILYEQTVRALTRGRPAEARDSLNALADVVTDYQLAVLELARQLAVQSFEWPAERQLAQLKVQLELWRAWARSAATHRTTPSRSKTVRRVTRPRAAGL